MSSLFILLPFALFSLTGSGSVTVESVQRHSTGRYGSSDDGHMDFSLTAIDLSALRPHLSGVIGSNKDRWKELSVHELANKVEDVLEEEEEEEVVVESNAQSKSPSRNPSDGHSSDQSAPEDPPANQTEHVPADCSTWNGVGPGEEPTEEHDNHEEDVLENA